MEHLPTQHEDLPYPACEYEGREIETNTIGADGLTPPHRDLLAHDTDMTSTLESFFEEAMRLQVLHMRVEGDVMFRQVLLVGNDSERVAEFGAIYIDLSLFDAIPRQLIEEGRVPLGAILRDQGIVCQSSPTGFLQLVAGDSMGRLLGCDSGTALFGRRNVLSMPTGEDFAHIVEILPDLSAEAKP